MTDWERVRKEGKLGKFITFVRGVIARAYDVSRATIP